MTLHPPLLTLLQLLLHLLQLQLHHGDLLLALGLLLLLAVETVLCLPQLLALPHQLQGLHLQVLGEGGVLLPGSKSESILLKYVHVLPIHSLQNEHQSVCLIQVFIAI